MEYKDIVRVNSEMTFTDIGKGKDYAEVPQRVQAFRKLFPEGTIKTEILSCENGVCIMQASVYAGDRLLATGTAYEREGAGFVNKTSYIENCETSAIGRALAFIGIGSEKSIASYEEVANAKLQQGEPMSKPDKKAVEQQLKKLIAQKGMTNKEVCEMAEVKSISDMHLEQMKNLIGYLNTL